MLRLRLVLILTENSHGGLFGFSDLQHWVVVRLLVLTLFTEVVVRAHTTFVPDSLNRSNIAFITDYALMHNL